MRTDPTALAIGSLLLAVAGPAAPDRPAAPATVDVGSARPNGPAGASETTVAAVYDARAFDHLLRLGGADAVRRAVEADLLPHTATGRSITLRSGLPAAELPYWLGRLALVQRRFFAALGPSVQAPVAGDPNPRWTVMVFATREQYSAYMQAFVGFGSGAGGLYLEATATLYTYQRRPSESRYTLEELLQHELTHALAARHVFAGLWDEPHYHAEPRGWLDEGLAEMLAGTAPGATAFTPRAVHLDRLCRTSPGSLRALLTRRQGYDRPGRFPYAEAWSFVYFLYQRAPEVLDRVVRSFRRGEYRAADLAAMAGARSLRQLQDEWHTAVRDWCVGSSRLGAYAARLP